MVAAESNVPVDERLLRIQTAGGDGGGRFIALREPHIFGVRISGLEHHRTFAALEVVSHLAERSRADNLSKSKDMFATE